MAACAAETRPMVSAVGKAAALLRAFDPGVDVLSTRALAARTGIPRSTVHVLATTLATEGLLETVPGRGWRLGPLLVGPGRADHRAHRARRRRRGRPGTRCCAHAGQEVHVGQLVGGWVVYLHREAGPDSMGRATMDNRVGLRAPAWRGGCGKAALARLAPAEVDERIARLCRDEGLDPPDRTLLADELAAARRGRLPRLVVVPGGADVGGRRGRRRRRPPARGALGGRPDASVHPGRAGPHRGGRGRRRGPGPAHGLHARGEVRRGARTTAQLPLAGPTERNAVVPPRR